ncbi:MAG: hypothetical protein OK456_01135 [Thaumarchaeota archaeon]|nr:hypothetical protein [Nitrososphaerota archaeon]
MDSMTVVALHNGFLSDGKWVRNATVRELNGYDEQEFARAGETLPPAQRTTAILDRVTKLEGTPGSKKNLELVRQLTVGDRVALMLHLRRLTFGDKMECIVTCPRCAAEMSVGLSADLLTQTGRREMKNDAEVKIGESVLHVRAITGADLEDVMTSTGDMSAEEALVRSCIVSSDRPLPSRLTPEMIAAVSAKLEELDPQAEIVLDLSCPSCGHQFKTPFFIEDFLFREVRSRVPRLEKEVHWIAFNYHWNPDEILSLPVGERGRYIEMINSTLSGESL